MVAYSSPSQFAHDKVNLVRFVKKLELSIGDTNSTRSGDEYQAWLSTQATLQKLKHARKLFKSVEAYEQEHSTQQNSASYLKDIERTLEGLQSKAQAAAERNPPPSSRPKPILPKIQPPEIPSIIIPTQDRGLGRTPLSAAPMSALLPSAVDSIAPMPLPLNELLLTPGDVPAQPASVIDATSSSFLAPSSSTSKAASAPQQSGQSKPAPSFLQNSAAVQQELQDQLAQMATQLKRNALHFSNSLNADKALVEAAGEKIESNFDVLQKERLRLRDRGLKARGQTCFVVFSLIAVVISFAFMVLLIRFTRYLP